jgi:putative Flp pilus-assembly TadE/G-like protein
MIARMHRREDGQAAVLTVVFLIVLLGMSAMAIDVGTWYHEKRALQAQADAAALAGAQVIPDDPGQATALAIDYASKNGGVLTAGGITFTKDVVANDTINVHMSKKAPGFFSRVLGISSVDVGARASARTDAMKEAKNAAPIGVDIRHPLLSGSGCPCYGQSTTLDLKKTGPGAFRLLNLDQSKGGTGPGVLEDWILNGLDAYMPLDWYLSDPGAKFNSSSMDSALTKRIGTELLFPVYSDTKAQGSNFAYQVVGWVGFKLTGFDNKGNNGLLFGYFTRVIWQGIQNTRAQEAGDFGARSVQLVN